MLEEQKESIRKIKYICNKDIIVPLDRLSEEIKQNNERLNTLCKEIKLKKTYVQAQTKMPKLSLGTLEEILETKIKKFYECLVEQNQQHRGYIVDLWKDTDLLPEKLRDLEDRSSRNNLRIDIKITEDRKQEK